MDFKDDRIIAATPERVWECLLDPSVLKECVPGCQSLTGNVDEGFVATVVQRVGPVKATFKGVVELSELIAPHSLRISGKGEGSCWFCPWRCRCHFDSGWFWYKAKLLCKGPNWWEVGSTGLPNY